MKDKMLNILLVFIAMLLIINIFNKKEPEKKEWILVEYQKKYSVPANINIDVINYEENIFEFNTCKDFLIKKFDKTEIQLENCENIKLKKWEKYSLDLSSKYNDFYDMWEYSFTLKTEDVEKIWLFEITNRWLIKKFFTFFFYQPIYNLMVFLLKITNNSLWLAIIFITFIIRLLLLYPQHKMMLNQKKMQLIQPKIKEIQKKHSWDHQTLWMELMKIYKEHKINPMWSFWLLFLQMPILIVMYRIIISIQSTSNTFYLYPFLSNYDLSTLNANFLWFDLFSVWWKNWLIFAIIVWCLQFIQVYLSNNKKKKEEKKNTQLQKKDTNSNMPDMELLNKFMMFGLPIMIWFFTYSFFIWVWLYWWIWTIFMIFQQLIVNKILKK